jgi:outer membrane receptor protein involved in Fe transport
MTKYPHHCRARICTNVRGALLLALLIILNTNAFADTKGKLTGRITDQKKEAVFGVNVLLTGTSIGAATDVDGYYVIVNVSPGVYTVRLGGVGYQTKVVEQVIISAGQTTTLDMTLSEAMIEAKEVTVVAQRPLVDTRQTSSVAILERSDINVLPVQNLNDVVTLQAGVVDGHFRGGRAGEVQYQVDGVSVNNPYDNTSVVNLDKSVLQEVQVISGTFDAEYGQAMSGVVNAILRSGSEDHFDWNVEIYAADYVAGPSGKIDFPNLTTKFPPTSKSFTLSLSGPSGLPKTTFLINVRKFLDDGFLYGQRRFVPTDFSDFQNRVFNPTGDNTIVPMNTTDEWSGQFKISNKSFDNIQFSYQAVGSISDSRLYDFAYRFNPDGRKSQHHVALAHGLDWTHSLSQTTFYTLSLRQNYFKYTDYAFASLNDPRYFSANFPRGDPNYELGAFIQGYDLGRFEQLSNSILLKGSITSQIDRNNMVKVGFEAQNSLITFGSPGTLVQTTLYGFQTIVPVVNDSLYPGLRSYYPTTFALFAQDRIELKDFLVRAGVRFEYYDANSRVPSDLENPANSIQGAPSSHLKHTTVKYAIAPRVGISYPVMAGGALYFSYGHFYQMPGLGILYSNSDYTILRNLQAGSVSYGVLGNPDIKPEFTTQYEFGFKQQFGDFLGADISVFYKDIRNLLGVEFIDTYADAQYARFTNVDFGSVDGVTLSVDQRIFSVASVNLNYTYQNAIGNASDPSETANRAAAGEDPRPRQVPFDWDQTHTLNLSLSLNVPTSYAVTAILRYGSGSPYTTSIGSGFGAKLEKNSSVRSPWATVDVRAEKYLPLGGMNLSIFARILNLLDARYSNGFVFATTGSPYYSLTPGGDAAKLIDPSRFAAPRRTEIGASARF